MGRDTRWWLGMSVVADTAVACTDLALGAGGGGAVHPTGLLALGPLLAATRLGVRRTALAAGYALALVPVGAADQGTLGTAGFAVDAATVALGGALALFTARRRDARERELDRVVRAARRAVLRPVAPEVAGVSIAARYHCVGPEGGLGGDLYDVADTPFGLRVIVGDASGQGLSAAPLASAVLGHFRDLVHTAPDLVELTRELDLRLGPVLGPEDFVTAVLAEFGPDEVRLVNCGHHPPLRIGSRLEPLAPAEPTSPLGISPNPVQLRARLTENERLLLYTDGLVEARSPSPSREMFAWSEAARLALSGPLLDESLTALLELLQAHTDQAPQDDLTLLLFQPRSVHEPATPGACGRVGGAGRSGSPGWG